MYCISDKTFTYTTFSDKEVCYAIQKGILASRSTVFYYNHNDLDHLVELLEKQAAEDRKVSRGSLIFVWSIF